MHYSALALALASALCSSFVVSTAAAQQSSTSNSEATDIERISVTGRAQTLYRSDSSSLATRTATPIAEIPQSIQVLPEALIDDQAARQITDLYRSISGVSTFSYSGVTFRGFRQDEVLYDGLRGDPFSSLAVPQLFNIAQVQVLKGPNGAMFGSGSPGGIINYVTKKPTATAQREISLGLGNDDYRQGAIELSGPLTESGDQRYRAAYYYDDEKPFRFNTEQTNRILDLGYAFDIGNRTDVTLQYTNYRQDYQGARLRGVPVDNDGNFLTDRRWNHNEATDFQVMDADVYQARLNHDFNSNWRADLTVRHYQNTELQNYHEPRGLIDAEGNAVSDTRDAVASLRQFRNQVRDSEATSVNANLVGTVMSGQYEHTLLFGWEYLDSENSFRGDNANPFDRDGNPVVPSLDLLNPQYGVAKGPYGTDPYSVEASITDTRRDGVYVQDQLRINERFNLLASLRYDQFEDDVSGIKFDDSALTYRIGATYQLTDWVRTYALYGTGFNPQAPDSQDVAVGGPFDPEESTIYELGARWSLLNDAIRLSSAVYQIERENILQATAEISDDGRSILSNVGTVRSRGAELDLLGDLTDNWVLNASYAYNDTRITDTVPGQIIDWSAGDRFPNAPKHQFGLWTRYELPFLQSSIGAGMDYVSERISMSNQRIKPYTVFDLSWQSHWQQWTLQVNVKNLFDKTYAASGFLDRTGHFPGEPRRIYASVSYSF